MSASYSEAGFYATGDGVVYVDDNGLEYLPNNQIEPSEAKSQGIKYVQCDAGIYYYSVQDVNANRESKKSTPSSLPKRRSNTGSQHTRSRTRRASGKELRSSQSNDCGEQPAVRSNSAPDLSTLDHTTEKSEHVKYKTTNSKKVPSRRTAIGEQKETKTRRSSRRGIDGSGRQTTKTSRSRSSQRLTQVAREEKKLEGSATEATKTTKRRSRSKAAQRLLGDQSKEHSTRGRRSRSKSCHKTLPAADQGVEAPKRTKSAERLPADQGKEKSKRGRRSGSRSSQKILTTHQAADSGDETLKRTRVRRTRSGSAHQLLQNESTEETHKHDLKGLSGFRGVKCVSASPDQETRRKMRKQRSKSDPSLSVPPEQDQGIKHGLRKQARSGSQLTLLAAASQETRRQHRKPRSKSSSGLNLLVGDDQETGKASTRRPRVRTQSSSSLRVFLGEKDESKGKYDNEKVDRRAALSKSGSYRLSQRSLVSRAASQATAPPNLCRAATDGIGPNENAGNNDRRAALTRAGSYRVSQRGFMTRATTPTRSSRNLFAAETDATEPSECMGKTDRRAGLTKSRSYRASNRHVTRQRLTAATENIETRKEVQARAERIDQLEQAVEYLKMQAVQVAEAQARAREAAQAKAAAEAEAAAQAEQQSAPSGAVATGDCIEQEPALPLELDSARQAESDTGLMEPVSMAA